MIVLTLPWGPTMNSMYPTGKHGRRFLSDEGKLFKEKVIYHCRQQLGSYEPLAGRLEVCYKLFAPSARSYDIGNREKSLSDCLTAARVWRDDAQIDKLVIERMGIDPDGDGYVEVEIVEISPKGAP